MLMGRASARTAAGRPIVTCGAATLIVYTFRRVRRSTSTEAFQKDDAGRAGVQAIIGGGTPNMTSGHAAPDQAGARPYRRRTAERLGDFPIVS
jgi:hypothetical protein